MKPASHRIGVRLTGGVGEFYDTLTGEKFIPRGMNYTRLAQQARPDGSRALGHSLFDPGQYDAARTAAALLQMHADGYNVVRVFLSAETIGTPTDGLSPATMANVEDFLRLARDNQIFTMFTFDWLPGGRYAEILSADCCSRFALMNVHLLAPTGLRANQAFYEDFIRQLLLAGAPTDWVFSYELRNEMYYEADQPPLSFTSGTVTTANGSTYDMARADDRQRMLEENTVYWIDSMRGSILHVDPTALVSVGFFQPQGPNATRVGDPRIVVSAPAIWQSQADFIDLHAYPGFDLSLKQYVQNFGLDDMQAKPVIMGEFGGQTQRFASVQAAAKRFVDWQVESCNYGFDGWLFWTWDLDEQPDFFNARMAGGTIETALAPRTRPDPCSAGASGGARNLALDASVTASGSLPDQPAANAADGSPETLWNSGGLPQQWIMLKLKQPASVTGIRLTVAQSPAGETVHKVLMGSSPDALREVHEFRGTTQEGQVLEYMFPAALPGVQYVRILTLASPSWVAWREVEVLGQ